MEKVILFEGKVVAEYEDGKIGRVYMETNGVATDVDQFTLEVSEGQLKVYIEAGKAATKA